MDYYAYYYARLKKNGSDKDPEFHVLLRVLGTIVLNVNTILIIVFKMIDINLVEKKYLLVVASVTVLICLFYWNKMDESYKNQIKSRIPHYNWYVYQGYSFFSIILIFLTVYLVSPNT